MNRKNLGISLIVAGLAFGAISILWSDGFVRQLGLLWNLQKRNLSISHQMVLEKQDKVDSQMIPGAIIHGIAKINFPEGMSKDDMLAVIQKSFPTMDPKKVRWDDGKPKRSLTWEEANEPADLYDDKTWVYHQVPLIRVPLPALLTLSIIMIATGIVLIVTARTAIVPNERNADKRKE